MRKLTLMACTDPNPVRLLPSLQTLCWSAWPLRTLEYLRERHADPFTLRMIGGRRFVMVGHPEGVRQVFTRFPCVGNAELRPLLGDNSLFLLQGQRHAVHRQVLQPILKGDRARAYTARLKEIAHAAVARLSVGQSFSLAVFARSLTSDVIMNVLFGPKSHTAHARIRRRLMQTADLISGPLLFFPFLQRDLGPGSPGRRMKIALAEISDEIATELHERAAGGEADQSGLIGALLASKKRGQLSPQELEDEVKTLLAAGYDPLSAALGWALFWIHRAPDVAEKLYAEIRCRPCSDDDDAGGSYLEAVCREALRIVPIVPVVDRLVTEPTELLDFRLEPGTRVVACAFLTHRREELFPDADKFIPDRFLERQFTVHEYYPFGGGDRYCLGAFFASLQLKVLVRALLESARFELARYADRYGRVAAEQRGATLAPARSFQLRVADLAEA